MTCLIIFACLTGLMKALRDTISFHFHRSIFMYLEHYSDFFTDVKRYIEDIHEKILSDKVFLYLKEYFLFYWLESSWEFTKNIKKSWGIFYYLCWFLVNGWHLFETLFSLMFLCAILNIENINEVIFFWLIKGFIFNLFFHGLLLKSFWDWWINFFKTILKYLKSILK